MLDGLKPYPAMKDSGASLAWGRTGALGGLAEWRCLYRSERA